MRRIWIVDKGTRMGLLLGGANSLGCSVLCGGVLTMLAVGLETRHA
jgi:hypothetical protein